jgi:tetratricopeptide (TPR) repeat protein
LVLRSGKDVDARDKRGHDVIGSGSAHETAMRASHRVAELGQMLREAVTLQQQGRLREAEKIYARVLKAVPDQFDALNLLGTVKAQRGQAGEAYRLITAALKVNPRAADAWVNLGIVLHALKRDQEALESFDKALALKPGDADALLHRGNALLALGRAQDALAAFDEVLASMPRHAQARLNRGLALAALGRHQEAVADFEAVLAISPANPSAHYNYGISLFTLGRYAEAVAAYDRALSIASDHVKAWNNRGLALQALNRFDDALMSYSKALELQKDYADAHFNQGLALLTVGDFRRGFAEYEWRWRRTGMPAQGRGRPLWLGEYPLGGRTILLHAEQGLGDTIQFARYVPLLARTGAKIVLEVQPQLKALLGQTEGVGAVVARGEPLPSFDVHCPLGSLPLVLRTEPATIPAEIPYLQADDARIAKWRPRLEALGRPRIAVAWSGNVQHVNDRNRSIPLPALAPLWSVGSVRFLAVQRDLRSGDAELLAAEPRVTQIGTELDDFADTAAVLALVDLVITVDTSVAHLAGAMGRPVWILVPFSPDWRWTLSGDSSRWYATARLFRQPSLGDWGSVIDRMCGELQGFSRSD